MSKRLFLSAITTLMMVSIPNLYAMAQALHEHHTSGAISDFAPKANNSNSSDVNGDGAVDVADISTIIDMMAGFVPSGTDPLIADVNGDGTVDVSDIAAVIDIMAGKGDTNPEENAYTSCPDENHPHIIDLGLPSGTKWACCNVGASTPEGYGNYYAWGETSPKSVYDWDTYAYYNSSLSYPDCYINIGSDIAGTGYDAATANWGAPCRMPSYEQCRELINSCSSTWTTQNGVNGRKFTGPNGGTIFLPAAGLRWNSDLSYAGSNGVYWSSTLYESYPSYACDLRFGSGGVSTYYDLCRYYGHTVRPVR